MIRQQFYPKNSYNSKSKSKAKPINLCINPQSHHISLITSKFKQTPQRKKSVIQSPSIFDDIMNTPTTSKNQTKQRLFTIHNYKQNINSNEEVQNIMQSKNSFVLKSNNNQIEINRKIMKRFGTEVNLKSLYINSNKKQLTMSRKKSMRNSNKSLGIENENFRMDDRQNLNYHLKKPTVTSRKLITSEISTRSYRLSRSINHNEIGNSILVGNSTLIAIDKNSSRKLVPFNRNMHIQAQDDKNLVKFEQMTNNIINLNLSKAIKYRQQINQRDKRKKNNLMASIKRSKQNLQNIQSELEQKVKGWQIEIEDDIEFY